MSFDFSKIKDHTLTRPRDEAWGNWKSWKDAIIGDSVEGTVMDAFYRPEEKDDKGAISFREQRGITLKQASGELINVGIKYLPFILVSTDNLRIGDPLRCELTSLGEKQKGKQQAKIFTYYGTNLPETEGRPTVKELTDADREIGGSKIAEKPGEAVADEDDNGSAAADAELERLSGEGKV